MLALCHTHVDKLHYIIYSYKLLKCIRVIISVDIGNVIIMQNGAVIYLQFYCLAHHIAPVQV